MTRLIKLARFSPSSAGSDGIPGDPGEPPRPGGWVRTAVEYPATSGEYVAGPPYSLSPEDIRQYGPGGRPTFYWLPGKPAYTAYVLVWVGPSPGRPPTPAVPAVPPTPGEEYGAEWDAAGTSLATLTGDVVLSFSVPRSAPGVVCGLAAHRVGGYESIGFALYVSHGLVHVMESGTRIAGPFQTVGDDTELAIGRRNGVVTYSVGGEAVHTGTVRSMGSVSARASIYSAGEAVTGAVFARTAEQSAAAAGSLRPLRGLSSDKQYAGSDGELLPLQSAAVARGACVAHGALLPLSGLSSNKRYTSVVCSLRPITGTSTVNAIIPTFSASAGVMAPLNGAANCLSGGLISSAASLRPLVGLSADRPYCESVGALLPLVGSSFDVGGGPVSFGYFAGRITGSFRLSAAARAGARSTAVLRLSKPAVSAFFGAALSSSAPAALLSIAGDVAVYGQADIGAPFAAVAASGRVSAVGGTIIASPRPGLVAFSGGFSRIRGSSPTVVASAQVLSSAAASIVLRRAGTMAAFAGAVMQQRLAEPFALQASSRMAASGDILAAAPAPLLNASGGLHIAGEARLTMPSPQVGATPHGIVAVMPIPMLSAIGGGASAPWSAAWVFDLGESMDARGRTTRRYAASEYVGFPFMQIVRFGGRHYGVGGDGLFLIGGGTDAGAPIAWAVETTISDFGSPQLKAMPSAFFGANIGADVRAKAVVGEFGSHEYSYPNMRGAPIQNHRVTFGRGMRSRYYGVRIEDESGGVLHLDSIDLEIAALSRKI